MHRSAYVTRGLGRIAAVAAGAGVLVALVACGGGGAGGGGGDGFPNQSGCTYQYTLTGSTLLTGADPQLGLQWHLNNTGQTGGTAGEDVRAFAAWSITRGEGARVAIVDDAVELLHDELAPNAVAGASYSYRPGVVGNVWPLPCATGDEHGTSVAGVVLARDANARGGAGVAPRASLVAYNALVTSYDSDIADALTRALADNGVYHNSWGSPDDGRPSPSGSAFDDAIEEGITSGRGGRGAVYVFPGGNGRCYATDQAGGCYAETTGLDGYLNQRGVIAVCAVDHRGRAPPYGERGANLLVCAPSGGHAGTPAITTTAVRNGSTSDFSGTSASAPMVSGVAALVLARNPTLSWRDVRLILAHSARRNDPGHPGWVSSPFAPAYNHDYGFGVVDAAAAVNLAGSWLSVGGAAQMRSCGPYTRNPGIQIADATASGTTTQSDAVTVGAECAITRIEYVEVSFSAAHAYSGDLRLRLVSPNALTSELVDARVCSGSGDACGAYAGWKFGSVRHLDEPPAGAWRLDVTDAQPGDSGVWQSWSLRLWGR